MAYIDKILNTFHPLQIPLGTVCVIQSQLYMGRAGKFIPYRSHLDAYPLLCFPFFRVVLMTISLSHRRWALPCHPTVG